MLETFMHAINKVEAESVALAMRAKDLALRDQLAN